MRTGLGFSFSIHSPLNVLFREREGHLQPALGSRNRSGCPGRAAFESAGCDPTVPSRGHLSGRRRRPFGGDVMGTSGRGACPSTSLGSLLSISGVPKDLRDCFLCLQLRRCSLVRLISSGWRGHSRAGVLICADECI